MLHLSPVDGASRGSGLRPGVDAGFGGDHNHSYQPRSRGFARFGFSHLHGETMSRNYYSEINLHVTWHVKDSAPLLVPKVEAVVHHYLRGRCINTPGVFIHEIGGIETHVHLCLSIAPTTLISELVGQLKGSSAHEVNQKLGGGSKVLEWQTGYGVVSFGTKDLEWVKSYVRNQRERHAGNRIAERLERITALEVQGREAEAERREAP
jgi:putative transposase